MMRMLQLRNSIVRYRPGGQKSSATELPEAQAHSRELCKQKRPAFAIE